MGRGARSRFRRRLRRESKLSRREGDSLIAPYLGLNLIDRNCKPATADRGRAMAHLHYLYRCRAVYPAPVWLRLSAQDMPDAAIPLAGLPARIILGHPIGRPAATMPDAKAPDPATTLQSSVASEKNAARNGQCRKVIGRPFPPGRTGNPRGRPKGMRAWRAFVRSRLSDSSLSGLPRPCPRSRPTRRRDRSTCRSYNPDSFGRAVSGC
jgi:hypothetical protein